MPFQHPPRICPVCGNKVLPLRENKRFCCSKCQKRFNNQKNKPERVKNEAERKKVKRNSNNLRRLAKMPQFASGVTRDILISGGVDLSVTPTSLATFAATGEQLICYEDQCIKLQDDNIPTYLIVPLNP